MIPVEIQAVQGSLILRARGSELLILPHHVAHLKGLKEPRDFTSYFMADALINRPARKLFEAWLRKDQGLWRRLYDKIQKDMEDGDGSEASVRKEVKGNQLGGMAGKTGDHKPAAAKAVAPKTEKATERPVAAAKTEIVKGKSDGRSAVNDAVKEAVKEARKADGKDMVTAKKEEKKATPAKKEAAPVKKEAAPAKKVAKKAAAKPAKKPAGKAPTKSAAKKGAAKKKAK